MCHLTPAVRSLQQTIPNGCPAKWLKPGQRLTIGLRALAAKEALPAKQSVTGLAKDFQVSRKFVYRQSDTAAAALQTAFAPSAQSDDVLFYLPVTKKWLEQVVLALVLVCHSSYRGVFEFGRDLLGVPLHPSKVQRILRRAVAKARPYNLGQSLAHILIAGLDEIFQKRRPVLVGADIASTYCFLLSEEENRDADTWASRLRQAHQRGLAPQATIADFGSGLRAGLKEALPKTPCRGDVFHALHEVLPVVTWLENRAYQAIAAAHRLQQKRDKLQQGGGRVQAFAPQLTAARQREARTVALADAVALLVRWLRQDVFAVSALSYGDRCALFDFILAELEARQALCPERLGPVCAFLQSHRDDLLAFAAQLDRDLDDLAGRFEIPVHLVRDLLEMLTLDGRHGRRWRQETLLRTKLGRRFYPLHAAVRTVLGQAVRASSIIENINSRLRGYFFLRRHLGNDYLTLLQFFLNHRRFLRSERCERVGKSPAELLTGQPHAHWLEMLGYQRFCHP